MSHFIKVFLNSLFSVSEMVHSRSSHLKAHTSYSNLTFNERLYVSLDSLLIRTFCPLRRQDLLHPHAHASADGVWRAAQGDAHESEGDHGAADVRQAGRGDQRLDGRHLLDAVAAHAQDEEGRPRVDRAGRAGGRHLDRELELGARRQQDADAGQWRPHSDGAQLQDHLRAAQHRQCVASYCLQKR